MKSLFCVVFMLVLSGCLSNVTEPEVARPMSEQDVATLSSSGIFSSSSQSTLDSSLEAGNIVDSRDGKVYRVIQIGEQWWMAQNLDFGQMVILDEKDEDVEEESFSYQLAGEKYCYNNNSKNCEDGGGFYQWHNAMALDEECGRGEVECYAQIDSVAHQGICPSGWHIPSKVDWTSLISALGGNDLATMKMKELDPDNSYWNEDYLNDGNSSGFSAQPTGYVNGYGQFFGRGDGGYFWEAQEDGRDFGYMRGVLNYSTELYKEAINKYFSFNIRCVLDKA